MKLDLFVLPEVMRRDFIEAFVLDREDLQTAQARYVTQLSAMGADFEEWYTEAYLWEKLSPDLPAVDFDTALSLLRERKGIVLFMSEAESSRKPCALIHRGRRVYDFVAMADPQELADRIEYEWKEFPSLCKAAPHELTLPEDLYVFDTTLDWLIVFTHELVTTPETRFCRAFVGEP